MPKDIIIGQPIKFSNWKLREIKPKLLSVTTLKKLPITIKLKPNAKVSDNI